VRPCLEKTLHKRGVVEWLMVKALSLSPSTVKKKKEEFFFIDTFCSRRSHFPMNSFPG
jgi:hypothetical protein